MSSSSDVDVSKDVVIVIDNDEDMKSISELLRTESGREMMKLLAEEKLYSNEIGRKLGLKSNMTSHYLSKMEEMNLVKITNEKITKGGIEHRFFHIPSSIIVIVLKKPKKDADGILKKIFKKGIKFCALGISTIAIFFITTPKKRETIDRYIISDETGYSDFAIESGNAVISVSTEIVTSDSLTQFLSTIVILGLGLFLIWYSKKNKKKLMEG